MNKYLLGEKSKVFNPQFSKAMFYKNDRASVSQSVTLSLSEMRPLPESLRERCMKKIKKKLTSVSFMYVCVAENAELLVFFYFFFAPSP